MGRIVIDASFAENPAVSLYGSLIPRNDGPGMKEHSFEIPPGDVAVCSVSPGKYVLSVEMGVPQEVDVTDEELRFHMEIEFFVTFRGRIMDYAGKILPDALVKGDRVGDRYVPVARCTDGFYEIRVLEGSRSLRYCDDSHPSLEVNLPKKLRLQHEWDDLVRTRNVQLPRGASIRGQWRGRDGAPLPKLRVYLQCPANNHHVEVAPDGSFAFKGCVLPGTVGLWCCATDDSGEILAEQREILWCEPGKTNHADLLWG